MALSLRDARYCEAIPSGPAALRNAVSSHLTSGLTKALELEVLSTANNRKLASVENVLYQE